MEIDLSDFEPLHRGPACNTGLAIAALSGERLEKALAALAAPHIQHAMISRRLTEWTGIKASEGSVSKHRKKDCGCA
jgi:hypothetical protein